MISVNVLETWGYNVMKKALAEQGLAGFLNDYLNLIISF
jgi:hypothetical protein